MSDTNFAVRTNSMRRQDGAQTIDASSVLGWGVDADPRNDPTYPYRDRSADDHSGEWKRPPQQQSDTEILQSVEHKRRPAVFGTASPPTWLSGSIRRMAFRWSESSWVHWLMLMSADRVNVVEGLVEDVARAEIPNIPKEMGVPAEWKHNKAGLVKKIAITAMIGGALVALIGSRKSKRNQAEPDARSQPRSRSTRQLFMERTIEHERP